MANGHMAFTRLAAPLMPRLGGSAVVQQALLGVGFGHQADQGHVGVLVRARFAGPPTDPPGRGTVDFGHVGQLARVLQNPETVVEYRSFSMAPRADWCPQATISRLGVAQHQIGRAGRHLAGEIKRSYRRAPSHQASCWP
jgi:hypothetical protein